MRDFNKYSIADFLKLKPFWSVLKQWRNDIRLKLYLLREAESEADFIEQSRSLNNKNVYIVIAYEQAQCIEWLLRMAQQHIRDATILVFDNSMKVSCRDDIKTLCQQLAVPYLPLPFNFTYHPNCSHGMAMTWVYERIIKKIEPNIFCFLDHDMIPVAPVEMRLSIQDQDLYGLPCVSSLAWSLWAGYSMFKYQYIKNNPVNFLQDFDNGLDTGGRNYRYLYKQKNHADLRFAESKNIESLMHF